jgi:CBS domain containing-hemolysin-like protein
VDYPVTTDDTSVLLSLALVALVVAALLAVLAALLERSGPIRLRHWAQEAGPALLGLYERAPRFEAYRFVVTVTARLGFAAFFGLLLAALVGLGLRLAFLWSFGALAAGVVLVEVANRHLVGRHPEEALQTLTFLFRWTSWLARPLLPLVAPLLPEPTAGEDALDEDEEASRAEIEAFIDVGRREGILEKSDEELVRGVVGFGDTYARSVMTPRIDIVCAPLEATVEELAELVLASAHTRIPIYRGSIDEVVGILHVRDLLRVLVHSGERPLAELLQAPHFVPETKSLTQLLRELQERHQEVAIVVDEYGGTLGMVTIEDLLEEIFGELGDSDNGFESERVQLPDGSWRVAARTHLEELEALFAIEVDEGDWETVGGLIFGLLGHVPRVGDTIDSFGLHFVVESADHRRARRVRVERSLAAAQTEGLDLE